MENDSKKVNKPAPSQIRWLALTVLLALIPLVHGVALGGSQNESAFVFYWIVNAVCSFTVSVRVVRWTYLKEFGTALVAIPFGILLIPMNAFASAAIYFFFVSKG